MSAEPLGFSLVRKASSYPGEAEAVWNAPGVVGKLEELVIPVT
jgi:hypothetical protein